jgi:hypothetical protein
VRFLYQGPGGDGGEGDGDGEGEGDGDGEGEGDGGEGDGLGDGGGEGDGGEGEGPGGPDGTTLDLDIYPSASHILIIKLLSGLSIFSFLDLTAAANFVQFVAPISSILSGLVSRGGFNTLC